MSSADVAIAALRAGHDDLAVTVPGLSDDDLAGPSGAAEWDISQVLSHLGSGAEIARARLQAALDGGPRPEPGSNQTVWDRWNAMSRRERADGMVRANETLVLLYESLDPATREELRIDMGFLPAPVDVAAAARLRLTEFALHAWDVRVGFDKDAALATDATAVLLHSKPDMLPFLGKADRLDGQHAVIYVTTTDPASVFTLRLQTPVSADFNVPEQADGTLSLPAETWLRLVAGRLSPQHTPAGVVTTGAADLNLLRRVFPGY